MALVQRLRDKKTGQLIPARDCWIGLPEYDLVMAEPGVEFMSEEEMHSVRMAAFAPPTTMPEIELPSLKEARTRKRAVPDVVPSQPENDLLAGLINGADG